MNNNSGNLKTIIIIVVFIALGFLTCTVLKNKGSKNDTPWGRVGASKSRYEQTYNRIKNG